MVVFEVMSDIKIDDIHVQSVFFKEKVPLCGLYGDSSESVKEVVLLCRSVLHRP